MSAKSSAVDRAYAWVRENILDGSLAGGSFIDEATVCNATGVSRTPAREAFNRLEGERFITLVPRKGAQVRSMSSSDLFDAFNARYMIESHAAAEFCAAKRQIPDKMFEDLAIMDQQSEFIETEDTVRYLEADRDFHRMLVKTLDNQFVTDFFETLWRANSWAAIKKGQSLRSPEWLKDNRDQHHMIAECLARHDFAATDAALRKHLKLSHTEVRALPGRP